MMSGLRKKMPPKPVSDRKKRTRRKGAGRKQTVAPKLELSKAGKDMSIERQVYEALRVALMSGEIFPGQSLTSRSISSALGISPTPVREALKRLEADGVLVGRSKSAYFVNELDQDDFREILDVRITLEGRAIQVASTRITNSDIERLRRLNEEYEKLVDTDANGYKHALEPNFNFHFEIYKLSGSKVMVEVIEALWLRIGPTLHEHVIRIDMSRENWNAHREIIDALERQDAEAAGAALEKDLRAACQAILPRLRARQQ